MPESIDLPGSALVALTRDSLQALRAGMYRDLGTNAASLLQEAGFSGGQAMYDAFGRWLAARGYVNNKRDGKSNLNRRASYRERV